jgi:hypothetical protein
MLFFTRQAEPRQRPRDGRLAHRHAAALGEPLAQLAERGVVVSDDGRPQQLVMSRPEARGVAPAVRPGREVFARAVQSEHLVDEGGADAEQIPDFGDRAVAAKRG